MDLLLYGSFLRALECIDPRNLLSKLKYKINLSNNLTI